MADIRAKSIAVTGASGHIGNVVCRLLAEKGYDVKAMFNRDPRGLDDLPVTKIQGDILSREDLSRFVSGCEVVIHCAAVISINGDPDGRVFKTNTEGTKLMKELAELHQVKKIIHISSVHAVQEYPLSGVFDENRPYKTEQDFRYDYSKAKAEQILLQNKSSSKTQIVILRPSAVIGPFDFKPSELGKALLDFYHQKIPVLPPGGYNFVDVRDVASSIFSAIENGKDREIYNLSGRYYSMAQFAKVIQLVSGQKVPKMVLPFWVLQALLPFVKWYSRFIGAAPSFTKESIHALKSGHPNMDNSKAAKNLNHAVRPLEESIRDFYNWHFSINQ
ncbi:MAG: NAD-dependent epimerase/dehydratase family protein [Saprospiraceae bacterium]